MKYNLIGKQFTKDGHTMFYEDVLRDLKRKEYLETEFKQAKKHANNLGDLLAKTEKELEDLKNEQSKK